MTAGCRLLRQKTDAELRQSLWPSRLDRVLDLLVRQRQIAQALSMVPDCGTEGRAATLHLAEVIFRKR